MNAPARPPAEGERQALRGFIAQYKVAAEKILAELVSGRLESISVADPEAGRLDDIQIVAYRTSQLHLDAYQVKWHQPGKVIGDAEFRGLLADMVDGRGKIQAAQKERRGMEATPIARWVAHLYSNGVASLAPFRGDRLKGGGLNVTRFLQQVWRPAVDGFFASPAEVPGHWRDYLRILAEGCSLEEEQLLELAPCLLIELDQRLPEEKADPGYEGDQFLRDIKEVSAGLKEIVVDDRSLVTLSTAEFLDELGPEWISRWRPRSQHEFPTPVNYEPIEASVSRLREVAEEVGQGYAFLFGSPGSGKSTLLTRVLRGDDRLAARYYAYVPGDDTSTRGEASAFLHDLLLALGGERRAFLLPPDRNEVLLRERLRQELQTLGQRALHSGITSLLLIDGLDHVNRDPQPIADFLRELPKPDEVPEGVLIIIGTRTPEDLPDHVRPAAGTPRRVIHVNPLSRAGVAALAERAGLGELADDIYSVSDGHPLLAQTFIQLAERLPARDRAPALTTLPPLGGEVMNFYETVWADVRNDPEVVELLGLVSHMRRATSLGWLRQTGSSATAVQRLERLSYLFKELGTDRWAFFHDSFREFLKARTSERDGRYAREKERAFHLELFKRCNVSEPEQPEAWEAIHHLLNADQPEQALAKATPEFFRRQLDLARPGKDVQRDIQEAALALDKARDSLGLARLALSANEAQLRDLAFPHGISFAELLVSLGRPELAIAQVGYIDDTAVDNDARQTAMRLVLILHDADYKGEAERLFELGEPLEWLGGRTANARRPSQGPWQALYAWARAATVMRGGAHVIAGVARLSIRNEDRWSTGPGQGEAEMKAFKANLLSTAADEALARGEDAEFERLLSAIDRSEPEGIRAVASSLHQELRLARRMADDRRQGHCLDQLAAIADNLPDSQRLLLAEDSYLCGQLDQSSGLIKDVSQPPVPDSIRLDGDSSGWFQLYRYFRLRAALGEAADPAQAIGDPGDGYQRQRIFFARHLVAQATLHGRQWSGEPITSADLVRQIRAFHAYWDGVTGRDRLDLSGAGVARRSLSNTIVGLARHIGAEAVEALWTYWSNRWDTRPDELSIDGTELLLTFARDGIGPVRVRARMRTLEDLSDNAATEPLDWVTLGLAWIELDDHARARAALDRSIQRTLSVGFRKDYQLSEWIRLLRPLLTSIAAAPLAEWLSESIVAFSDRAEVAAPNHAAQLLVRTLAEADPPLAFGTGQHLIEGRVLDVDEVVAALLRGTSRWPTELWWSTLSEILVPLGTAPPIETVTVAAEQLPDRPRLLAHLHEVADRVSVEGRPTTRMAWRSQIIEAGSRLKITMTELGIAESDLIVGDETPDDRPPRKEPDEDLRAPGIDTLFEGAEDDRFDYNAVKTLIGRFDELDDAHRARLDAAVRGTDWEAMLEAAKAQRALRADDADGAWDHGLAALQVGSARDWQRKWGGGPVLDAISVLQELDSEHARPLIFSRFSYLAATDEFMLGETARELSSYVEVFEPLDENALAREIWSFVRALLREDAPTDAPVVSDGVGLDVHVPPSPDTIDAALIELVASLFGSPYLLAWGAAQRALLARSSETGDSTPLCRLLDDQGVDDARVLAVVEALLTTGFKPSTELIGRIRARAAGDRLDLRSAARTILEQIGEAPPGPETRSRSPNFDLRVPRVVVRDDLKGRQIGSLDIHEMIGHHEPGIRRLAEMADVDYGFLVERITALAERDPAAEVVDELLGKRESVLGWGYVRPSASLIRRVLARTCAELFDAGKVNPYAALLVCHLWPLYDPWLLEVRPERRPNVVGPVLPFAQRESHYQEWFVDLDSAKARLAGRSDGWLVVGEYSELALLDRHVSEERREQALVSGAVEGRFDRNDPPTAADNHDFSQACDSRLVIFHSHAPGASPDQWLALHPAAARKIGLSPDPDHPLAWLLDGDVVVRSLWWRSGFTRWRPYSPTDEVGEGWLVMARASVLERLAEVFSDLRIDWGVVTSSRREETSEPEERTRSGHLPVKDLLCR